MQAVAKLASIQILTIASWLCEERLDILNYFRDIASNGNKLQLLQNVDTGWCITDQSVEINCHLSA